jgi:hypothetical protein
MYRLFNSALVLVLSFIAATAQARDPERFAITDSAGKEIFVVDQVYNGKRAKNPNTKPTRDPERFDVDFYQITYKNLSADPITVMRMASGLRYGVGTIAGVKKGDANDSWGAGFQERDLSAQPMFDNNVLAAGKSTSGEAFITTNGINFLDRVIQIEHLGKTYDLKWGMKYYKGE